MAEGGIVLLRRAAGVWAALACLALKQAGISCGFATEARLRGADIAIGGAVTSLTTFNPFRLPGFATGSYWTAQIYELGHGPEDHEDSDHAMEWIDGGDHDPGK